MAKAPPPPTLAEEIGKTGPYDSPGEEAYLTLVRTADRLTARYDRLFREHGLSQPLYNALRIAAGHGADGVATQTIGKHLVQAHPDVTRLVDKLVALGLAERARSADDRRVVRVKVTASGTARLRSLRRKVRVLNEELVEAAGPARLRRLVRDLDHVRAAGGEKDQPAR